MRRAGSRRPESQRSPGHPTTTQPLIAAVASASLVAEGVAVEVEQRDEDRVDRDEDDREHRVDLITIGVAVDGEIILMI